MTREAGSPAVETPILPAESYYSWLSQPACAWQLFVSVTFDKHMVSLRLESVLLPCSTWRLTCSINHTYSGLCSQLSGRGDVRVLFDCG